MNVFGDDINKETIVLGGGCFWCTEAVFKMLKGVIFVEPGYAGGTKEGPIFEEVASGETGYAEVVSVKYDPEIISLNNILTVFFATHDPTTKDKQGGDVGSQYRSIIFYTSEEQKKEAKKFIEKLDLSSKIGKPILTEVRKLDIFYPAEEHHKNYYKKHPEEAYCQLVINPKLEKVKKNFSNLIHN